MKQHRDKKRSRKAPFKKQLSSHSGGQRTNKIVLLDRVTEIFFQFVDLWEKKS